MILLISSSIFLVYGWGLVLSKVNIMYDLCEYIFIKEFVNLRVLFRLSLGEFYLF